MNGRFRTEAATSLVPATPRARAAPSTGTQAGVIGFVVMLASPRVWPAILIALAFLSDLGSVISLFVG